MLNLTRMREAVVSLAASVSAEWILNPLVGLGVHTELYFALIFITAGINFLYSVGCFLGTDFDSWGSNFAGTEYCIQVLNFTYNLLIGFIFRIQRGSLVPNWHWFFSSSVYCTSPTQTLEMLLIHMNMFKEQTSEMEHEVLACLLNYLNFSVHLYHRFHSYSKV